MPDFTDLISSPRVVATVHSREDLDAIASGSITPESCDVLEFRLDSLSDSLDEIEAAMSLTGIPSLITARHPAEGGAGDLSSADRESLLRRFLGSATLIDLEIRSLAEMPGLVAEAGRCGIGMIGSCHDFEKPLAPSELEAAVNAARESSVAAVKVAMVLDSMADLSELVLLTEKLTHSGQPIAAMGMGPLGKVSRLTLAAAGSCLNYGFLTKSNAPGQWPAAELKHLLGEILPES